MKCFTGLAHNCVENTVRVPGFSEAAGGFGILINDSRLGAFTELFDSAFQRPAGSYQNKGINPLAHPIKG
jgi:hypothetical protein